MIECMIRLIANTEGRDANAEEQLRQLMDRAGAHGQGPAPACEVAVCADPDAQPFVWLAGERKRATDDAWAWFRRNVGSLERPSAGPARRGLDPRMEEMLLAIGSMTTDLERMLTCLGYLPAPFDQRDLICFSPSVFYRRCILSPTILTRAEITFGQPNPLGRDSLRIFDIDP